MIIFLFAFHNINKSNKKLKRKNSIYLELKIYLERNLIKLMKIKNYIKFDYLKQYCIGLGNNNKIVEKVLKTRSEWY